MFEAVAQAYNFANALMAQGKLVDAVGQFQEAGVLFAFRVFDDVIFLAICISDCFVIFDMIEDN